MKESKGNFIFDRDTKRQHRFLIKSNDGITGLIYVPQTCESVPTRIILEYQRPEEPNTKKRTL